MNILLFFDFLYFSIYAFYAEDNEQGASSSAQAIVGGLLAMNMLTVFMLGDLFRKSASRYTGTAH